MRRRLGKRGVDATGSHSLFRSDKDTAGYLASSMRAIEQSIHIVFVRCAVFIVAKCLLDRGLPLAYQVVITPFINIRLSESEPGCPFYDLEDRPSRPCLP